MSVQTPSAATEERSTPDLLRDFTSQLTTLIHQEAELARGEIEQKAAKAGAGAGLFAAAGTIALVALGVLAAAAVLALATAVDAWIAALIVGGALLVLAGLTAVTGRSAMSRATPPVPEHAIASAKEDVRATANAVKEARA
jgi:uncharacterized membrane protein YqjE